MRPSASYRGARRNEAKQVRGKQVRAGRGTVSQVAIAYSDVLKINAMRKARVQAEGVRS